MKIKITADSTCDLSPELIEKYDFSVFPLHVLLGETDYLDGVTVTPDDIYKYYGETKKLPKSGARSAEDYKAFFKGFLDQGYEVVHFDISDLMSASYSNAKTAAAELGKGVYVVDSKSLSTGTALLMLSAADLAATGKYTAAEVAKKTALRVDSVQASFVVDNLEFLHKGGRCSSVAYLGANLLAIKPCIEVKNGSMIVGRKYVGRYSRVVMKYVDESLKIYSDYDKTRCFVTHTKMSDGMTESVIAHVKSLGIFDEVLETTAGCTITTHCGEGTLGILYINDCGKN